MRFLSVLFLFFFFNDTATTEIYTLSLHDALPILIVVDCPPEESDPLVDALDAHGLALIRLAAPTTDDRRLRSEEHTSELQSRQYLVCRLLLEKKKKRNKNFTLIHNDK